MVGDLIERYLTMSHCASHMFTSSGLLEPIEGSFPSISGTADTSKRSFDGYDESCVQETYHRLELLPVELAQRGTASECVIHGKVLRLGVQNAGAQ